MSAAKKTAPTAPFVTNPVNGEAVNPYLGGDPPLSTEPLSTESSATAPEDRGDAVATEPETKVEVTPELSAPVAKEPKDTDQRIPKPRFDEVNERRKVAEARVAELEKQIAKPVVEVAAYDFDAQEDKYIELLLDGKTKEARAVRTEIRAAERAEFDRLATTKATETNRALSVEDRLGVISAKAEEDFPQFNPESEVFSEDLLDDVKIIYAGHLQSGKFADAADAFQAAIDKATKLHGVATVEPAAGTKIPARTAQKRVDAITSQPPLIAKVGHQSGQHGDLNVDVHAMTEADFARLPEATKRRLRGDDL